MRAHVDKSILVLGCKNHIDLDKWCPFIMSFRQFYGLGDRVQPSKLAEIPEESYTRSSLGELSERKRFESMERSVLEAASRYVMGDEIAKEFI